MFSACPESGSLVAVPNDDRAESTSTFTNHGFKGTTMATKPVKKSTPSKFAVVRCRNAGVHAGEVVSRKDGVVTLKNSRRLWRWWSAATLSELSQDGPVKIDENKYGCVLPVLELTESDVCEVIPCSEKARAAILAVPVWQAAS
jgi:hypothetical protein